MITIKTHYIFAQKLLNLKFSAESHLCDWAWTFIFEFQPFGKSNFERATFQIFENQFDDTNEKVSLVCSDFDGFEKWPKTSVRATKIRFGFRTPKFVRYQVCGNFQKTLHFFTKKM